MTFYRYFLVYKQLENIKIENFIVYLGVISVIAYIMCFVIYPEILKAPIKVFLVALCVDSIIFGYLSYSHITIRKDVINNIRSYNISSIEYLRQNVENLEDKYDKLDSNIRNSMSKEEYIDIILNIFYNNVDFRGFAQRLEDRYVIESNNSLNLKISPDNRYIYDVNINDLRNILGVSPVYRETFKDLVK